MEQAENALKRHADAINARSLDAYRESMVFPFTYQNYNGVALTHACATDVDASGGALPWDIILRTDPNWSHTTFETMELVARSASCAVYKVAFRRIDKAGLASLPYDAIWIATCPSEQWGIQFRHNLGMRPDSQTRLPNTD